VIHLEGQGQEHSDRRRRPQAGQYPNNRAEKNADEAPKQIFRREGYGKSQQGIPDGFQVKTLLKTPGTGRQRESWRQHEIA
jgi:hypothetical protein